MSQRNNRYYYFCWTCRIFYICGAAAIILMFSGCIPFTIPSLLIDEPRSSTIRDDWERYGAYYEIDELFVEAAVQGAYVPFSGYYSEPVSKVLVSKRIRILTKDGTQYGTVAIPRYYTTIQKFDIHLYDDTGNEKPLNTVELRAKYEEGGVIVFPNVTPGCQLDILIEYVASRPILVFEHWFSDVIPVRHGRFTFSRIDKFDYDFKEYGAVDVGNSRIALDKSEYTYTVWSRDNVLPRSMVEYQGNYDKTEPRVAVAMRYGFDKPVFSSWEDITGNLRHDFIEEPYTRLEEGIDKVLDSLLRGSSGRYDKADRALHWLQDNVSLNDEADDFSPDEVIKKGKGSLYEIALTCRKMFESIGLESDIIFTRPHRMGGFDEKFITPQAASIPIVTVSIDNKEYCAYPYTRGGVLGEYPLEFFDLKGVSIRTQKVVSLPQPLSNISHSEFSFQFDLADKTQMHRAEITFDGYAAYRMRSMLITLQQKEITEGFQKILSSYDKANALKECSLENLAERGKPLRAVCTFSNSQQNIERKGVQRISLSHLFDSYLDDLDTSRTSPFEFAYKATVHETIKIIKPHGKKVEVTMLCEPGSNELFVVNCSTMDNAQFYEFSRDITINPCTIFPKDFTAYFKEISKLNQVNESYVLIK